MLNLSFKRCIVIGWSSRSTSIVYIVLYYIFLYSFETNQLIAYDGWLDNGTNLGVSGIISIFQEMLVYLNLRICS